MKNLRINTILFGLTITLASCSFVSLSPQAQDIIVVPDSTTLSKCKFLGDTNVSLWSKATTFQSQETVEKQLDILARNEAAKMNGNFVTPDSKINDGQRAYRVYNCPTTSLTQ